LTKPWRTLSGDRKEQIVALVRTAIDALGFENCATHTETKLMANGGIRSSKLRRGWAASR
jgi:hypothetical protein